MPGQTYACVEPGLTAGSSWDDCTLANRIFGDTRLFGPDALLVGYAGNDTGAGYALVPAGSPAGTYIWVADVGPSLVDGYEFGTAVGGVGGGSSGGGSSGGSSSGVWPELSNEAALALWSTALLVWGVSYTFWLIRKTVGS